MMFKNLMDFSYKRTPLEAVGFYIVYLFLLALVCGIIAGAHGALVEGDNFQQGVKIGHFLAIILCPILSFIILAKKRLTSNFLYVLAALLSGVLAIFLGGLLGLIPTAFLTTRENKNNQSESSTTP